MNREKYKQSLAMIGAYQEVIIEGGNHAGFGDYGRQAGDGEASISPEAQWGSDDGGDSGVEIEPLGTSNKGHILRE